MVTVYVVVVFVIVGLFFRNNIANIFTGNSEKLSGYQAVFLTNGQVYFGKISETGNSYAVLKDVYYLQSNDKLQSAPSDQTSSQLSLVKLGNELHGPEDQMNINRDQILFFENLKTDGKVAQAIAEYQKNKEATLKTSSGNGASLQGATENQF